MLTHHDVTVKDAGEIFEQCKDLPVKFWGFKNVGLPKDEMKKVAGAMKAAGKTTFLEVVTYDEASCLDGAQTAIDCGFDYLMGTVYYDSVAKLLKENGMAYLPFVGKVSGSPSILEGTNEEIIQNAKDLMAKGIKGFDILAYRHVVDGEKLAREFCAAIDAEICIAGSINSYARIDTMFDIGPWTFTMGSALFEKKFVADGSFRDNLKGGLILVEENKLKKALTAAGIWSVAVGAVISGSYYGWNYIASETNFTGCLIAMAIATLFYIPFAFMFAELATAIPSSAGPAAYTEKAFGRGAGFFAGFSYLVESLFCTPGICIAVGAYVHTLFPVVPAVVASVVAYLIFLFINMRGIEAGQLIGLIVTVIGVAGVVFYACIGLPHADFSLLGKMGDLGGVKGIFVAIPYAVWFYLAFEAGGMGAEECKNPSKDIPKGFIVGIFTLLIGGMLMLVTTFSLLPKEELLKNDAPIANVINHLFGEGSTMSIVFIVIAMIGLIASLNGIIIGQSRQTYALARCKCLPGFLGKLDKNGTPINALLTTSVIGIVLTLIGSVDVIVVIANMGSAFMALCCFISWIKLAKDQPDMPRPYKCPRWLGYIGIPFCLIVAFCSLYSAVTAGTLFYIAVAFFVIAMLYYAAVCKKKNGTFLVEPEDQ